MKSVGSVIQDYLNDLALGQACRTVETYGQGMRRFVEYLQSTDRSIEFVTSSLCADDMINFAQWLAERQVRSGKPLNNATRRIYLTAVSRFFDYVVREGFLHLTASDLIRMRESVHKYRHGHDSRKSELLPAEAVVALLNAARGVKSKPQNRRSELARLRNIAMLEALRSSGMRVGELVDLKCGQLECEYQAARIVGKGNRERLVYFDDTAWNAIYSYLAARMGSVGESETAELPVFARHDRRVSNRTLPLTTDSVRLVFNELAATAGIKTAVSPQSLRQAFAAHMFDVTSDLALVQDMLGHESPATTRIYAKVSDKKMRKAHKQAFGYREDDDAK